MKANIFNKFFADQCTPLENDNVLTTSQRLLTSSRLFTLNINEEEIIKLIRSFDMIFPLERLRYVTNQY